ncbi:hypothetical protein [Paenibacillus sp. NFR01]|uniref:hypothetical protein n=1 Tax=Paenibacillus sp. NFR01 TaxID=1566279 RepID=UPI0008CA3405|nr:hypothetical protein [Paenibacillus sp. NFR01]SET56624.1 hypothetical protein SAMN03159358_2040 [Paenibacillus sp. NFR01]
MSERAEFFKEKMNVVQAEQGCPPEFLALMEDMLAEMAELERSNKALRRAVLKSGQASTMSTRLREALYE